MQSTRKRVILVREFASGVKSSENDFHATDLLTFVFVNRHASPIIFNTQRPVLKCRDTDLTTVAGDRFINAVIDYFLSQMIGSLSLGIHARALAHWLQPSQNLNRTRVVAIIHTQSAIYPGAFALSLNGNHKPQCRWDLPNKTNRHGVSK